MDIAESCYKMDWYRCSPKVKRTLFILMERSKIPLKVMAGNFFDLTLGTLTMVRGYNILGITNTNEYVCRFCDHLILILLYFNNCIIIK